MRGFSVVAALLGVTASGVVYAEGFYLGRASFSPGYYTNDGRGNLGNTPVSFDGDGFILAADLGGAMGFKLADNQSLLFDLELEAMTVDGDTTISGGGQTAQSDTEFERTDVKLTVGYSIRSGLNYSPFIGTRIAYQGDGFFNDDFYSESGFFVGFGISGIEMGSKLRMSGSVSYNQTELDTGSSDVDADGYSVRLGLRSIGSPLGYSLKYQTFDTDPDAGGTVIEEGYLLASLTWYFMQGKM